MMFYPKSVSQRICELKCTGTIAEAEARATCATPICGCALIFEFRIERESGRISVARFRTNGCGFVVAGAEVLAEEITGKILSDLHGLDDAELKKFVGNRLGIFPADRGHCLELCLEALHGAFANFREAQIESWQGEEALICTCFGVSEKTIEKLVCDELLEGVEDVSRKCNAGLGCGSCQPLIQDIIDSHRREFRSS